MGEDRSDHERLKDFQAKFLAKETGITESQARELIETIGTDHASLLREARLLKTARIEATLRLSFKKARQQKPAGKG
ncbi:hypothetical protein [Mesorhizobium sp. M0435]|uniref:hypothetical protein n=1 Tax=unclassified Mesorhizobium TaxID=325217 RepID=UPI003337A55F